MNNAGIPDAQRAHKMSLELIDQVIDVNLRGLFILSCEVARRLLAAQGSGPDRQHRLDGRSMSTAASGWRSARSPRPGGRAHGPRRLVMEWARFNINVNGIAPGAFFVGDDGRHAGARGRHHPALPASGAWATPRSWIRPALPRVAGFRFRNR